MCDQLAPLGIEFSANRLSAVFAESVAYAVAHPDAHKPTGLIASVLGTTALPWAKKPIFPATKPEQKPSAAAVAGAAVAPEPLPPRPWALGPIRTSTGAFNAAGGFATRRPGLLLRVDPDTNEDTAEPLLRTAESIHSSVRVRLACGGLGVDDKKTWACEALLEGGEDGDEGPLWRLERDPSSSSSAAADALRAGAEQLALAPRPQELAEDRLYPLAAATQTGWRWVYVGKAGVRGEGDARVPSVTVLPEEPLVGRWERLLLAMTAGKPDVWKFADEHVVPAAEGK
jgi:hypothetical protein